MSNLLDPERSQHGEQKRKSVRAPGYAHTRPSVAQTKDILHVQRERRRRIKTATGTWLKAFDS